jgi:hypothetical protein
MALHHMDALHDQTVLLAEHLHDLAGLALVATGDHNHLVALLDLQLRRHFATQSFPLKALQVPAR